MKQKLFLIVCILSMFMAVAKADKRKIGDLWYEVSGSSAAVTYPNDGEKYSDEIFIPDGFYLDADSEHPVFYVAIKEIGSRAFADCSDLKVHVPAGITRIVPNAFEGCTNLTIDAASLVAWCRIRFNTYDDARQESLYGAQGAVLETVEHFLIDGKEVIDLVIPEDVPVINDKAFYCYSNLQSVEIASKLTHFGSSVFACCENLKTVRLSNTELAMVGNFAFSCCPKLENVSIASEKMETVGVNAFYHCCSLKDVTLPSSVRNINKGAFQKCTALKEFSWPEDLVSVGDSAFKDCIGLNGLNLHAATSVGAYAFNGCTSIEKVIVPQTVTAMGNYAFAGCTNLKELSMESNHLDDHLFENCISLETVTMSNSIKSIHDYVFSGCRNLRSIDFPNSLRNIGRGAFMNSGLLSVTIPEGVLNIIYDTFRGCQDLQSISFPSSILYVDDNFYDCPSLKDIHIKDLNKWQSVKAETNLLKGRRLLLQGALVTEVAYPEGEQRIDASIFNGYEYLDKLILPSSTMTFTAQYIGGDNLSEIYSYAETIPLLGSQCFSEKCTEFANVYVPGHVLDKYRTDSPDLQRYPQPQSWSIFKNIQPLPGTDEKCATPTIVYDNGKLKFTSDTPETEFVCEITDSDVKIHNTSEIDLTATYNIRVYAKAKNRVRSDVVYATLCWIDADPKVDVVDVVAEVKALPVIIEHINDLINVKGLDDGQKVTIYSISGLVVGSCVTHGGVASCRIVSNINGPLLVRMGSQTVKIF